MKKPNPEQGPPTELREMHICTNKECYSPLVQPVAWEEMRETLQWKFELYCPECETFSDGIFSYEEVEHFDEVLENGSDRMREALTTYIRQNMEMDLEVLVGALAVDAILPEDF